MLTRVTTRRHSLYALCYIVLQTDGPRFLRVVHAGELCDIVQAVHADELKHSRGYKKVMEYVSYA